MRIWNLDTSRMCDQHLLGEHVECHMFASTLNSDKSIQGYLDNGLLEIHNLEKRHNSIALEFKKRGMNHKSPLQKYKKIKLGKIDIIKNKQDLLKRCPKCRKMFKLNKGKLTVKNSRGMIELNKGKLTVKKP